MNQLHSIIEQALAPFTAHLPTAGNAKRLFYVACYSHRQNQWTRFLVTAADDAAAMAEAISSLSPDWKAEHCSFVCTTNDDVYQEL